MNGKDVFLGLKYVGSDLVEEAARESFPEKKRIVRPRPFLIAAVIALTALLVGCAAAVLIGLQQRRIAELEPTGQAEEQTEEAFDVITLFGYEGSPHYDAAKQWYAYLETYDPELQLMTDTNELGIPENYWYSYNCYTFDMVKKVDEICASTGLRPMGVLALVQSWNEGIFLDAVQIPGLTRPDTEARVSFRGGYFYPEGAFKMDMDIRLSGLEDVWSTVMYTPKSCFDPKFTVVQSELYDQWTYTTTQGVELMIAMYHQGALIFTEREDGYITVTLATDPLCLGEEYPTRELLERIAEVYDFTVCPTPTSDMGAVRQRLEQADRQREEHIQEASQYGDYAQWMKSNDWLWYEDLFYALMDINGDGMKDLLLGYEEGTFSFAMTMADGAVRELVNMESFRICEDGTLIAASRYGFTEYYYFNRVSGYSENGAHVMSLGNLRHDLREDTWLLNEQEELTPQEAQAMIEKYVPIEVPSAPLGEYPVDQDGKTLSEYIADNTVEVSEEQRMELFREYIRKDQESAYVPSTHYMLRDLDGDGMVELLLTYDESCIKNVITVRNGKIHKLYWWTRLYLCEDNVLEFWNENEVEESHSWFRIGERGTMNLDQIFYDTAQSRWYMSGSRDGVYDTEISREEFEEILSRYPRIPMDFTPIVDFPNA